MIVGYCRNFDSEICIEEMRAKIHYIHLQYYITKRGRNECNYCVAHAALVGSVEVLEVGGLAVAESK